MISVIVPVFNEEGSLIELYQRIVKTLDKEKFELIVVNDGSRDRSKEIVEELKKNDKRVVLINFRRNQGKSRALMAGFRETKGELVVTLDADLQDQPEEIDKLLLKLEEGFDLVSGWKRKRNDPFINVLFSRFFNFIIRLTAKVYLHDINCGLKVYRREVIESLDLYGDLYRFIPVLVAQDGFKVAEVEVTHFPRQYGHSKYGFSKFFRGFLDLFTVLFLANFAFRPLHLFGLLGGGLIGIGLLICFHLTVVWFRGQSIGGRPLLFLGILSIITGIQLFTSGLLAELIVHNRRKGD
jgi:glycosyltransferase involved in cell wall biosynthesis